MVPELIAETAVTHFSDVYRPVQVVHKMIDKLKRKRDHSVKDVPQLQMANLSDNPTAQIIRAPKRTKLDAMLEGIMRVGDDMYDHAQPDNFSPLALIPVVNEKGHSPLSLIDLHAANEASNGLITGSGYAHTPYQADLADAHIIKIQQGTAYYEIDSQLMAQEFGDKSFGAFADEAYASERGYAIRTNPHTGNKEMFVAGTRNGWDWASNALEVTGASHILNNPVHSGVRAGEVGYMYATGNPVPPEYLGLAEKVADTIETPNGRIATPWRAKAQEFYSQVVVDEEVDVVYGHSRGGAIVADMQLPAAVTKIGLDSAMILADNKGMINFYQGGRGFDPGHPIAWFKSQVDMALGSTGENNIHLEVEGMHTHELWNHDSEDYMLEP
uniref:Viral protein 1 n=1 Tax=Chaetoceros diatodnavirus 1 TaxID=1290581 RepID=VP1_CDDV1|nr:RecName: Full=Viral protein 1; Short=VP1 [Chaetoceros setoense DNA virus]